MSTITELAAFISTCTKDELGTLWTAGKQRDRVLRELELARLDFFEGQQVTFDRGPARGGWCTGTVKKVNPKKIKVDVKTVRHGGIWNVPKQLLEAV
ncbi:MAG: hypothetical protein KAJ40_08930 [Alphaproteobacteria bacterium]|nr:hypothetical protein [Alphaproteobacteria bacterium]